MDQAVFIIGYSSLGLFGLIIILDFVLFWSGKGIDKRLERKAKAFYSLTKKERPSSLHNDKERRKYLKSFCRSLSTKYALSSFNLMLKKWGEYDNKERDGYLKELGPLFAALATIYERKPRMSRGYFAYFLSRYDIDISGEGNEETYKFLLSLCLDKSVYTRENAYRALVKSLHPDLVKEAFKENKSSSIRLNPRVVTEVLLCYPIEGSHELLSSILPSLYSYSLSTQVGVLNYLRLVSGDYKKASLALLSSEKADREIKFCCLRYLKKYPLQEALPTFIKLGESSLLEKDEEMMAVVASSLGSYPSKEAEGVLLNILRSESYVGRRNAADSLIAIGKDKALALAESLHDPYALDMMKYRLENAGLVSKEEGQSRTDKEMDAPTSSSSDFFALEDGSNNAGYLRYIDHDIVLKLGDK